MRIIFAFSIFLLMIFCGILSINVTAQDLLLRRLTVKDGMPSNTIYCVFQDSKGFIWFCTDQGIGRFDGHSFVNYTTRDGLPDNEVFLLKEDKRERIWISSYNGKISFIQNDRIYNAGNNVLCQHIEQDSILQKISLDAGRTPPHILLKNIDDPAKKLIAYSYFNVNEVTHINHTDDADLFFIHDYLCLVKKRKIHTILTKCQIAYYHNGILYVYSQENYNWALNKALYGVDSISVLSSTKIPVKTIYDFCPLNDTTLMLATDKGVLSYTTTTGTVDTQNVLLKEIKVSLIKKDKENNYWFTTLNDGAFFLSASKPFVYKNNNETANAITSLAPDILVCGYSGREVRITSKGTTRSFTLPEPGTRNRILKIIFASASKLIVGTDYGLYSIDIANGMVKKFKPMLLKDAVKDIYKYNKKIYLANVHGAAEIDSNGNILNQFWNERTTAIAASDSGVWLGTLRGAYKYQKGKQIQKVAVAPLLSKSRITDIEIAKNGDVIFLTNQAGLYVWNGKNIQYINERNGLSSNICRKAFVDEKGNVWILTNYGLDRLYNVEGKYLAVHFPLSNGLTENDIIDFTVAGDNIYISCAEGVVQMSTQQVESQKTLQTYITSVNLNDTILLDPGNIVLPYKYTDLTINFTAIAFDEGQNLTYKYILDGSNTDTIITKLPSVNFGAIRPGKYVFKVWAKGNGSIWSDKPATLSFTITTPFWQKGWFLLLALTMVGLLIYMIVRRRIKAIQKTERTKTALNKKMAVLEMQALRAQINPHFIFNALNAIQNYYNINDERNANRYMTMFANLIRRTLSHSKDNWICLSEEISMLQTYVELEKMRFKNVFDFEIHISENIDSENEKIPAMMIQPFVENAINHGLRHLQNRHGKLVISFSLTNNNICCIIEDNGIGFQKATIIEKDTRNHEPMGMNITQGRIDTMNLLYNTYITVNVTHKNTPNDNGTIINITIPITKTMNDE